MELSELLVDGPFALSGNPVVIAYISKKAMGNVVICENHILSFPRSVFPHWFYGNNSIALRSSRIALWV